MSSPVSVSMIIGTAARRGSWSSRAKASRPISPSPMWAWRSRRESNGRDRVVEVEAAQGREAEPLLDLGHEVLVAGRLVDGVAGGEGVAGVEADADALGLGDAVADAARCSRRCPRQEPWPAVFSSSTRVGDVRQGRQHAVERGRDAVHPRLLAGSQVRAGVEHQPVDPQPGAARELVRQRLPRFLQDQPDRCRRG